MLTNYEIQKIVKFCVNLDSYSMMDISSAPFNYLVIQIFDNKCRVINYEKLQNGKMEQRQYSIVKMLRRVLSKYTVPNSIFAWCHHDRTGRPDLGIFTHARLKGSRNLLAPDHTFYGYPNRNGEILNTYTSTHSSLVKTNIEWSQKRDESVFIGNMSNPTNYRQINTDIVKSILRKEVSANFIDQCSGDSSFISRESLSESKYLLHLNGHGGAYTSRLKYLLGAGSLVIYNVNSGPEQNFWQEWWMQEEFLIPGKHYLKVENAEDTANAINNFHENQQNANIISQNGKKFFCDYLSPECIDLVWSEILKEYSSKCTFTVNEIMGFEYTNEDYEETDE